jgi:hypothetical protein
VRGIRTSARGDAACRGAGVGQFGQNSLADDFGR